MTNKSPSRDEVANPTNLNVEAIAKLEHEALQRRSVTERVSDGIVMCTGKNAGRKYERNKGCGFEGRHQGAVGGSVLPKVSHHPSSWRDAEASEGHPKLRS
jgi:hypothetical protein